MPISTIKMKYVAVLLFLASSVILTGCGGPPAPGADDPVTIDMISGSKLTSVKDGITWAFTESEVEITSTGKAIAADVVNDVLGNVSKPKSIKASFTMEEKTGLITLTGISSDGNSVTREAKIKTRKVSDGTISLGNREYNAG